MYVLAVAIQSLLVRSITLMKGTAKRERRDDWSEICLTVWYASEVEKSMKQPCDMVLHRQAQLGRHIEVKPESFPHFYPLLFCRPNVRRH